MINTRKLKMHDMERGGNKYLNETILTQPFIYLYYVTDDLKCVKPGQGAFYLALILLHLSNESG